MDINVEDLKVRFREIKNLIAYNELDRAFKRVMDFANDFGSDDIVIEAITKHREYVDIKTNIRRDINAELHRKEITKLVTYTLQFITETYNKYINIYEEFSNE